MRIIEMDGGSCEVFHLVHLVFEQSVVRDRCSLFVNFTMQAKRVSST